MHTLNTIFMHFRYIDTIYFRYVKTLYSDIYIHYVCKFDHFKLIFTEKEFIFFYSNNEEFLICLFQARSY